MIIISQMQHIRSPVSLRYRLKDQHFSCTFYIFIGFSYLFVGMFSPDVITFIIVMILSALDFWTVKNVTGRLLVGLRWWSDYDQKGEEVWKFQSFDKEFKSNSVDKTFFWTAQLASTVTWAVFLLIKVLSLSPFWVNLY